MFRCLELFIAVISSREHTHITSQHSPHSKYRTHNVFKLILILTFIYSALSVRYILLLGVFQTAHFLSLSNIPFRWLNWLEFQYVFWCVCMYNFVFFLAFSPYFRLLGDFTRICRSIFKWPMNKKANSKNGGWSVLFGLWRRTTFFPLNCFSFVPNVLVVVFA